MRAAERDVLLFLLAIAAGSADGWSYFGLAHAFVANVTGNTVLLGVSVFQRSGNSLHPAISLACYAVGVVVAALVARKVRPGAIWATAISAVLVCEGLLLAAAELAWFALEHRPAYALLERSRELNLLLGCVAFSVGLQSGAMVQLKVPGVVTTYITGTWTQLMNGIAHLFGSGAAQSHKKELQFEERLWMQAGILAVYFAAAVLTGWFFRYWPQGAGLLSTAPVLLAGVYGALRFRSAGPS